VEDNIAVGNKEVGNMEEGNMEVVVHRRDLIEKDSA